MLKQRLFRIIQQLFHPEHPRNFYKNPRTPSRIPQNTNQYVSRVHSNVSGLSQKPAAGLDGQLATDRHHQLSSRSNTLVSSTYKREKGESIVGKRAE